MLISESPTYHSPLPLVTTDVPLNLSTKSPRHHRIWSPASALEAEQEKKLQSMLIPCENTNHGKHSPVSVSSSTEIRLNNNNNNNNANNNNIHKRSSRGTHTSERTFQVLFPTILLIYSNLFI